MTTLADVDRLRDSQAREIIGDLEQHGVSVQAAFQMLRAIGVTKTEAAGMILTAIRFPVVQNKVLTSFTK